MVAIPAETTAGSKVALNTAWYELPAIDADAATRKIVTTKATALDRAVVRVIRQRNGCHCCRDNCAVQHHWNHPRLAGTYPSHHREITQHSETEPEGRPGNAYCQRNGRCEGPLQDRWMERNDV